MIPVFSVYGGELYCDSLRTVKKMIIQGIATWVNPWIQSEGVRRTGPTESEVRLYNLSRDGDSSGDWHVVQPNFVTGGSRLIAMWNLS